VQAIVMAAGEGRRLRPITERWPKPILPIDGLAVIATLVRQLQAEGIGPITVVVGHLAEQVQELLDGLDVRFVRQPRADGSADAVQRALEGGAGLPAIVTAADTVFRPGDLARVAGAERAAGAVAYRRDPRKARIAIEDGVVTEVVSRDESMPFSSAPVWLLTEEIDLTGLPGPPFELSAAFQRAIDAGKRVVAVEIGPTRDLTAPIDLARENFPYLGS
jgi:glucose-1-phosphate thymidylyltransferase